MEVFMTNRELGVELGKLAREERRITNEILKLINVALERRAFLEHGFPSVFEWLVRGFGYSHSGAFRRIEAARMLKSVSDVAKKLESGELNLTTLSKAQTAIRAQEKASGQKVTFVEKEKIVEQIENKSAQEAEQILCSLLPEAKLHVQQERKFVVDENTTRHSMNFSKEMSEDLKRAKDLLSHKFPNASDADILAYALKVLLDKTDPLRKSTSAAVSDCVAAAASKRVTKSHARRMVLKSTNGGCAYRDPLTGQVCGSHHQIELDHITPKALGGTDDPDNLRPLCKQHNLLMAEHVFGKVHMDQFRRPDA
jgi:5-methylcytosine-specific restriction endonuclease McrA